MGHTTENTQDAVVESVLPTTEKVFIAAESANCPDNSQAAEMVYFQIED